MADDNFVKIPDIGGSVGVDVIEILVKPGDRIDIETPLIVLESDKASMEIPSSKAGIVDSVLIHLGDKVSEGDTILSLVFEEGETQAIEIKALEIEEEKPQEPSKPAEVVELFSRKAENLVSSEALDAQLPNAGPGVRRLARVLGIDLAQIIGTGPKSRISTDDLEAFIKQKMNQGSASVHGISLPPAPFVDFSEFGPIEVLPLSKLKRLTGVSVLRAHLTIPQVTQFDEADITDLEAFRVKENLLDKSSELKLTLLAFIVKVVSYALHHFPSFNASLDASGEQLIHKKYINIGIAVETPQGLVVPVIKAVDQLSIKEIAKDLQRLSGKAREKALLPNEMRGSCFTISSLGGIGGTAFTPIVNGPEVAILGVSRAAYQPIYQDGVFIPRLILPLSLSYDHRVIDGAEGARFSRFIAASLADIRRIIL